MNLLPLRPEHIPAAIAKAELLRQHHEPEVAESICRDILFVQPRHQEAVVKLILSLTDQFRTGGASVDAARKWIGSLDRPYEQHYYRGVVYERWARSLHKSGVPDAVSLEWYVEAMREFDKARGLSDPSNDEAVLRWNACLRSIQANEAMKKGFSTMWERS